MITWETLAVIKQVQESPATLQSADLMEALQDSFIESMLQNLSNNEMDGTSSESEWEEDEEDRMAFSTIVDENLRDPEFLEWTAQHHENATQVLEDVIRPTWSSKSYAITEAWAARGDREDFMAVNVKLLEDLLLDGTMSPSIVGSELTREFMQRKEGMIILHLVPILLQHGLSGVTLFALKQDVKDTQDMPYSNKEFGDKFLEHQQRESAARLQLTDVERYSAVLNALHLKALVMIIGCIFSVLDVESLPANAMAVDVQRHQGVCNVCGRGASKRYVLIDL